MKKQPSRYLALVLAFLMVVTSFPLTPLMAMEDETVEQSADEYYLDVPAVETTTPTALEIEEEDIVAFAEGFRTVFATGDCRGCSASLDGDGCECAELDSNPEPGAPCPDDIGVEPLFYGRPPAPRFSHQGGVFNAQFDLSIHGHGADVRFTTDGREPVVCATGLGVADACRVLSPTCGCSPLLRPDQQVRINHGHGTGAAVANSNSPMSVGGVGRGNPAPWNVGWSQNADDEDSSYVTPNRTGGTVGTPTEASIRAGNSARGSLASPPSGAGARVPNPTIVGPGGGAVIVHNPVVIPAGNDGYFVPNPIYNGMVVRARGFGIDGRGGDTTTGTFIVNTPAMNWDNIRILSIVTCPADFIHPVRGFYRNWDRGMNSWSARNSENPNHWVNANFYNWEAQIRAGMWDGLDFYGNPAPPMQPHPTILARVGNNPCTCCNTARGWGLEAPRNEQGRLLNVWDNAQAHRPISNIEVFDEQNRQVVNQGATTWAFGNWTRMFPIRSIRINFNQGDGDVILTPGGPELIPGMRRHFYAANEPLLNFRHIQVRNGDTEGTDLRDVLSHRMAAPLRPVNQHATFGAVFINGEFWGMHNLQAHRHEHLVAEMFGIPRNIIQWTADESWIRDVVSNHIAWPSSQRGIRSDNVREAGGTRRSSTGETIATARDASYVGDHGGYGRVIPAFHPRTGRPETYAGFNHLTPQWFDFINTIMCMDDLIDMFIIGMHFENWDWISNNFEAWRTDRYIPGVHGADQRWRFIMQDFDNAVFHGSNDMLTYFTAMKSPACTSSCWHSAASNAACFNNREGRANAGGGFVNMGMPFAIFDLGRSEDAARLFRILLQNPTFRQTFAARYSTYTGTVFHPARALEVVMYYANFAQLGGATPAIGRHHIRWGLFGINSPLGTGAASIYSLNINNLADYPITTHFAASRTRHGAVIAPWTNPATPTASVRATMWDQAGTDPYRWPPHSLRSTAIGEMMDPAPGEASAIPGVGTVPPLRSQLNVLRLRAAGTTTTAGSAGGNVHPAGHIRNSIEQMRAYFSRSAPSGTMTGWGREHNPTSAELGGGGLGAAGSYSRVTWVISGGMPAAGDTNAALEGRIGWFNVAGAHIRPDLFRSGNPAFYADPANNMSGFTPFSIGNFSARYLQNMPITVTINEIPGQQFTNWTLPSGVALVSGALTDHSITVRPSGTGGTVTANFATSPQRFPIINQVYGLGLVPVPADAQNAVSHSFIELYNPWPVSITLNDVSLQIQNIADGAPANLTAQPWNVVDLSGTTIPSQHSYLIRSTAFANEDGARLLIDGISNYFDRDITHGLSNRNVTVALVHGQTPLSPRITVAQQGTVIDLVGARNSDSPRDQVHNVWGPQAAHRISRSAAVRRIAFQNTRDNWADFEEIRYSDILTTEIAHFAPRSLASGAWPVGGVFNPVTIEGAVDGYRAFPNPAYATGIVTLRAGMSPVGMAFDRWTTNAPGVTIILPTDPTEAFFVMPNAPVTVTANFIAIELLDREPSIMINQMHGSGPVGTNSISHGFIELFNPTDEPVSLLGKSLQVRNEGRPGNSGDAPVNPGTWNVLALPDHTMLPGSSFLVVSGTWSRTGVVGTHRPRYIIPRNDMVWANMEFSNRSLSAAIVSNTTPLVAGSAATSPNVIDLVGARNTNADDPMPEHWGAGVRTISRQLSVRRINFQNSGCNLSDFETIDYRYHTSVPEAERAEHAAVDSRGINNVELQAVRPRSAYDGQWGGAGADGGAVIILGGGRIGWGATPNPATAGTLVRISAGYNDGFQFNHWEVLQGPDGLLGANANQRVTSFIMPPGEDGVTLLAHWDEFYTVTVNHSRAPIAQTGAGTYSIGDRVVLVAGTRVDAHFFTNWTGFDVHLLADRNSPITFFYMPNRNVTFNANWHELEGSAPFPMQLVAIANEPGLTHAAWATTPGHFTYGMTMTFPYSEPIGHANGTLNVTAPGNHTLVFCTQRVSGTRADISARRFVHITVHADGAVTSPSTFRNISWDNRPTHPHGRVSLIPGSDIVYISYRAGDPQTITNPRAGIPAGHVERTLVPLFNLNVIGSEAPVESRGEGRFPEYQVVGINAGQRAGEAFTGWTIDPPGSVVLADRTSPITSFEMPEHDVTVTATWGDPYELMSSPSVIIHQVYGQGMGTDNAVSHGFIELFNTLTTDIELGGKTLQIWNAATGSWQVMHLPYETMEPGTSFLIVCASSTAVAPRHTLGTATYGFDYTWTGAPLRGRSLSIAIVNRTVPLSPILTNADWINLIDLVGVQFGTDPVPYRLRAANQPALRTSNVYAARRVNFQNTRINANDFAPVDFTTASLLMNRPRSAADGPWVADLVAPGETLVIGGGTGSGASPATGATDGTIVTINAGTNAGFQFSHWTVISGGVTLENSRSASTTFTMLPDVSVAVQANWRLVGTVTIEHEPVGGGAGHAGYGHHAVGDRVVIFAGTGASGNFFCRTTGWTGPDAHLLANRFSPITYFTMPDGAVSFTANWERRFQPPNFPIPIRLIANTSHTGFTRGMSGTGWSIANNVSAHTALPRNFTANVGQHTAVVGGNQNDWGIQPPDGRWILFTVGSDGSVVINHAGGGSWNPALPPSAWWNATADARVTHHANYPGVNFISFGPLSGLPSGHVEGYSPSSIPTNTVTVNGAWNGAAAVPIVDIAVTGAGNFPAGNIVGINAGYRDGHIFAGWTITAGSATLANTANSVTYFTMPAAAVTFTANWVSDQRTDPVITLPPNYPTAGHLTATFGSTIGALLPQIQALNPGAQGTFSWVEPFGTVPGSTLVGALGTRTHIIRFTPTNLTAFNEIERPVQVRVLPTPVPTLTFPAASNIILGDTLALSTLTGGVSAPAAGVWAWVDGTIQPLSAGTHYFAVSFRPTGTSINAFGWADHNWDATTHTFNQGPPLTITDVVAVTVDLPPQRPALHGNVLINQIYAQGTVPTDSAVSHGFIELVNRTGVEISLEGYSLQVQNIAANVPHNMIATPWDVLTFNATDTIPPYGSFLVRSTATQVQAGHVPRHVITVTDRDWNLAFSSNNMSAALVYGTEALTNVITDHESFGRVVDLVGVHSRLIPQDMVHNYLGQGHRGFSRYRSARRLRSYLAGEISLFNTPNNLADFAIVDFRYPLAYEGTGLSSIANATDNSGITNERLQEVRPRASTESTWANEPRHVLQISGAADDTVLYPSGGRVAGTTMRITVTAPAGQIFSAQGGQPITVTGAANVTLNVAPNRFTATGLFIMPAGGGTLNVSDDLFETVVIPEGLIINQMLGRTFPGNQAVSRGFIELYNPTDAAIPLANLSLQVQYVADGSPFGQGVNNVVHDWHIVPLNSLVSGVTSVLPNHSILLVTNAVDAGTEDFTPRINFMAWDGTLGTIPDGYGGTVPFVMNNRNFSAAIVTGMEPLNASLGSADEARILDLVGAVHTRNNGRDMVRSFWGVAPAEGLRQSTAVRRDWDGNIIRNSRRNSDDFIAVDFSAIDDEEFDEVRPRRHADGAWPAGNIVTVNSSGERARAIPRRAEEGNSVTLFAGTPPNGYVFHRWTTASGVTIANENCATTANFTMIDGDVTVTAEFLPFAASMLNSNVAVNRLVVNQFFGQGRPDANAVSHGFIELYNNSSTPINLQGLYVQVQSPADPAPGILPILPPVWQTIALPNQMLLPQTSFLIVSNTWFNDGSGEAPVPESVRGHSPALRIDPTQTDLQVPIEFSNRTMVVAITEGGGLLSPIIAHSEWGRVIDLVGSANDNNADRNRAENFLGAPIIPGITRNQSVRRVWDGNSLRNTRNNLYDFARVNLAASELHEINRPRYTGDGLWPVPMYELEVTPASNIVGVTPSVTVTPTGSMPANTEMSFTVSAPFGYRFAAGNAITVTAPLQAGFTAPVITFAGHRQAAWFELPMPAGGISLTIHAMLESVNVPTGLLINQMYGRAPTGNQAVNRGFIEIYNPTNAAIPLEGLSLQVQNLAQGGVNPTEWAVLDLSEDLITNITHLAPRTSLLVVADMGAGATGRHIIANYDAVMDIAFSNRNFSAAIVAGVAPLTDPAIAPGELPFVIDLVGAINTVPDNVVNFRVEPALRISNSEAARRVWNNVDGTYVISNSDNNRADFAPVRYAADGISDEMLALVRPRYSGDGEWVWAGLPTVTVNVTGENATGATYVITPSGGQLAGTTMTVTVTAPDEYTFTAEEGEILTTTGVVINLTVSSDRTTATGTFIMPAVSGTAYLTADFEQDARTVLASMTYTNNMMTVRDYVLATGGLFANHFRLTTWDNNTQRTMGDTQARTPIVFPNSARVGNFWGASPITGMEYAMAFQVQFRTSGHSDITFTSRQKSTGTGPNVFSLAYRIGETGAWTLIPDSQITTLRVSNDTYAAFDLFNPDTDENYTVFELPATVNNRADVFLRVFFSGPANLVGAGNTSINDIVIHGMAGYTSETFAINVTGGTADHAYAQAGDIVILTPGEPPLETQMFDSWTITYGADDTPVSLVGPNSFIMPHGIVTATANWRDIPDYYRTITLLGIGEGALSVMHVEPGQPAVLNPGVRDGFVFTGWTVVSVEDVATSSVDAFAYFSTTTPAAFEFDTVEPFVSADDIQLTRITDTDSPYYGMYYFTMVDANVTVRANWTLVGRIGDLSGDGRITSADATTLSRWIVAPNEDVQNGLLPQGWTRERMIAHMDINGDGVVCSQDVVLLARWLAGHQVSHLLNPIANNGNNNN